MHAEEALYPGAVAPVHVSIQSAGSCSYNLILKTREEANIDHLSARKPALLCAQVRYCVLHQVNHHLPFTTRTRPMFGDTTGWSRSRSSAPLSAPPR